MESLLKSSALPTAICLPDAVPVTPLPVTELNSATLTRAISFASAPFTMAAASGCSLERSTLATSCNRLDSSIPDWGITELSVGFPSVRVPVLSMISVSTLPKISSASALRIRIPARAPLPVPTMIAMGVASPRAHGQATISTATAFTRACAKRGSGPAESHTTKVTMAATMTAGTKYEDTRSASR